MGNDDVRYASTQRCDRILSILIDVDDQMRRLRRQQRIDIDVFRAAHLGYCAHLVAGMNAETGARHDLMAEVESEEQLGEAGNQGRNAQH